MKDLIKLARPLIRLRECTFPLDMRINLLTSYYPNIWTYACKTVGWMANSVDPDQTPRSAASDLGLHCLLRPVYSNTVTTWIDGTNVTVFCQINLFTPKFMKIKHLQVFFNLCSPANNLSSSLLVPFISSAINWARVYMAPLTSIVQTMMLFEQKCIDIFFLNSQRKQVLLQT